MESPPWRGAVPLAVAAAAALFVAGGMDLVHRHQRTPEKPRHDAKPASESKETEPRFVVGVAASGAALIVRDVRTGDDVGLPVAAPAGRRFHRVDAVKDGSYVVATYADRTVKFHRLTLDDDGRPEALQDVPKATVPGVSTSWSDLAVSPDGTRIAYVTYQRTRGRLDVISTETGTGKVWTTKLPARVGSLSWSGTTLAFVWSPVRPSGETHQLRTLDTNAASGDLKVSKAVLNLPEGGTTAILNPDGKTVVAGIMKNSHLTVQTFTLTGKPAKVLWRRPVKNELTALDISPAGKTILATAGDLYSKGARAVPGEDLADATW
ncbi:hypothetical protein BZB76_5189 [Actinomadura pelletieri DSM 43383]|uniref:WD40 repeat protein n=1 Tax=Actinomadura pelletieri DSM 43383 TaxID=1120940 RepID=A0A495QFK7_9ACTN|nr:hypothetical protein [Actinomadura pelletieri]RKS70712.1 hypothetical protein BZB76_5189 [Actinomadura pelletieri DSM 43383]